MATHNNEHDLMKNCIIHHKASNSSGNAINSNPKIYSDLCLLRIEYGNQWFSEHDFVTMSKTELNQLRDDVKSDLGRAKKGKNHTNPNRFDDKIKFINCLLSTLIESSDTSNFIGITSRLLYAVKEKCLFWPCSSIEKECWEFGQAYFRGYWNSNPKNYNQKLNCCTGNPRNRNRNPSFLDKINKPVSSNLYQKSRQLNEPKTCESTRCNTGNPEFNTYKFQYKWTSSNNRTVNSSNKNL